jgi:predicted GNAT superfamily acetyltransferase
MTAEADQTAARAAAAAGVAVRELSSIDELAAVVGLFDEVWVPQGRNSLIHLNVLRALVQSGNYAGGALGELLGACVGFFGPPSHAELHSHITGVPPAGAGRSVGLALKLHQRAWALRRGADVIAWTFDPTDITEPFLLSDGHLDVPTGPRLGVTPIAAELAEVTTWTDWIAA